MTRKILPVMIFTFALFSGVSAQEQGEILRFNGKINLDLKLQRNALLQTGDTLFVSGPSSKSRSPFNRILFNGLLPDSSVALQVKTESTDGNWTGWQDVKMKIFPNGRFWARLDLSGKLARRIQYRFLSKGLKNYGRIEIYAIEVLNIKENEDKSDSEALLKRPDKVQFAFADTIAMPSLITRGEWGAQPPASPYVPHDPYRFAQHHTAGRRIQALQEGLDEMRFIQDFHQSGRGWQDIGYHFCMDDAGRLYEGVPTDFRGTHTGGNNTGNLGVCLFGNFDIAGESPTQASLDSLVSTWSWLAFNYGVNPDSLYGHRDYKATACPGENFYPELPEMRNGIRKMLGFGRPYVANPSPQPFSLEVSPDTGVLFLLRDDEEGVDLNSIRMTINGETVTPSISGGPAQYVVLYQPSVPFASSQNVVVGIEATDLAAIPNSMSYSYRFAIEVEALQVEVETAATLRNATLEINGNWFSDDKDVSLAGLVNGNRLFAIDDDGSHSARVFPAVAVAGDYRVFMAVSGQFLGESAHYRFVNSEGMTHPHFTEYNSVYDGNWNVLSPNPVHFASDGQTTGFIELSGINGVRTRLVLDALRLVRVDRLDLPAPPTLKWVRVTDSAANEIEVAWYPTLEGDVAGYRLFLSEDGRTWSTPFVDETIHTRTEVSYSINYTGASPTVYFRAVAVDTNGVESEGGSFEPFLSNPTDTYGVGLQTGAKILIVDNFDRRQSWTLPYHPFVRSHGDAIAANGYGFDSATETAIQSGEIELKDYDVVFYFCGDDSRSDESLAAADQHRLLDYLENGGKLFISGSEIGYDFDATTGTERARYEALLKAKYAGDLSGSNRVLGGAGTPFEGLDFIYGTLNSEDTYIEDFPDYISPQGGSQVALSYDNLRIAAVHYTGPYGSGNPIAQLIYLGFTFETIIEAAARAGLMKSALEYFNLTTGVAQTHPDIPERFELSPNFPNPFGGATGSQGTTIHFYLPRKTEVAVTVFNVLGQRVATIAKQHFLEGGHEVNWDGRTDAGQQAAAGLYFYRLEAPDVQITRKLLLVR